MSHVGRILLKTGIINEDSLKEFRKWRLPLPEEPDRGNPLLADRNYTVEGLIEAIEQAMQDEGYVLTRETDLDVLMDFLRDAPRPASLFIHTEQHDGVEIKTMVGRRRTGEFILPWNADSINDWLTNGESYLLVDGKKVFFGNVKELFYGDRKAFLLATPTEVSE